VLVTKEQKCLKVILKSDSDRAVSLSESERLFHAMAAASTKEQNVLGRLSAVEPKPRHIISLHRKPVGLTHSTRKRECSRTCEPKTPTSVMKLDSTFYTAISRSNLEVTASPARPVEKHVVVSPPQRTKHEQQRNRTARPPCPLHGAVSAADCRATTR